MWIYLVSLAGEVVCRFEGTGDAFVDRGITAVVSAEDGVLEPSRVRDIDVKLAVFALLGDGNARTDGGDVRVEDEGDEGLVGRELGAHGALRTPGSSVGDTSDGDLDV